ncbi:uncharacterized protein LOC142632959 [Castanea sativa]|uniref:uncharacterized protein LOC142632959 n=1 Tax=Castanea sativa TaxID=21020 RepID=UPI003F64E140
MRGDTTLASSGKRFVLPSSFTRSPRYMIENYQDAMAICRWTGYLDLFITFTCNTRWPEIDLFLSRKPRQKVEDRPDVIARVFKIKLDKLLNDLKHGQHFGKVIAVVYTVEYQKRGLPHAHILLFLHHDGKHPTAAEIDRIISAEIPDLNEEPLVYEAVKQYMVHGPCISINSRASCMIENKCTNHFPKKFCSQTTVDEYGFPIYRRRNNGRFVERNEVKLDNQFIVPYNIELLVKFQAHINVEWCNRSRSIKYLFKYITKGPDRATLILEENLHIDSSTGMQHMTDIDVVKTYLNCRYVSAIEACWRIFEFAIHHRGPAIQRLNFHNKDEQPVVFEDTDYLNNVVNKPDIRKSKFTEWMKANALYEEARELTYSEFPTKWLLSEDILHRQRTVLRYDNLHLDDFRLQNYALCEIEQILTKSGRQILPVISKGRREQIVEASINKSSLWNSCKFFILTINLRLTQNRGDIAAREFAEWILKIGDGELSNSEDKALIEISHDLLIQPGAHSFNNIVKAAYPDFDTKFNDSKYLEERAILAPTNEVVEDINGYMIDLINADEETYLSANSYGKASSNILDQDVMHPIEFLNSLKFPGIPNHKFRLKVGLLIMLLRNLNQSNGLCNGTRLLVTQLSKWVLEAQIISGTHIGEKVFIPRIVLSPSNSKWPFVLKRRQFPICYDN